MMICPAEGSHISGMLELLKQVGEVHHQIRPDIFRTGAQKYDEGALQEILTDETRPIFVAVEGDRVLGYCFCVLRSYDGRDAFTPRQELYIDDLCVDESSRGSGVAEALYRHTLAFAQAQGCRFVTLNVWCGNGRAQRFYEKMGLRPRSVTMEVALEESAC